MKDSILVGNKVSSRLVGNLALRLNSIQLTTLWSSKKPGVKADILYGIISIKYANESLHVVTAMFV